jgi:hypothetical protein
MVVMGIFTILFCCVGGAFPVMCDCLIFAGCQDADDAALHHLLSLLLPFL